MSLPVRSPVRFGFVGAGWVAGRAVAPAVHAADGAVLQAIAARDPARAQALDPAGRVHASYADLVDDPDVDVVYVNLTNEAHLPWTLAALRSGKHVLCEKPLGLSVDEVAQLQQAADAAGRLLVEALWYRWHPRMRRLEALVASGAVGALTSIRSAFCFRGDFTGEFAGNYRLDPARGGGALYDVGCYALSGVHAVAASTGPSGEPGLPGGPGLPGLPGGPGLPGLPGGPEVLAAGGRFGASGVDVEVSATLRWADGLEASMRCGIDAPAEQELRVVGAEGTLECGTGEAFTVWRAPSSLVLTTAHGRRHEEEFGPVDAYVLMVEAVCAAVRGEAAFLPGPAHTAAVAATTAALRTRLATG